MTSLRKALLLSPVAALALLVFGGPPIQAAPFQATHSSLISEVVVQYTPGAPLERRNGKPWGSQCVDKKYRELLARDRGLGSGMWVIKVDPPLAPRAAARVVAQLAECVGVGWAEASTLTLQPSGG